MRNPQDHFCSSMYEEIIRNSEYTMDALPVMVPIAFLFGTQTRAQYTHSSIERVKTLYKQPKDKILSKLSESPPVLCGIGYESNALSLHILDGHTRSRYLPQAKGLYSLPTLVFPPETIVRYLQNEQGVRLHPEQYAQQVVDRSKEVVRDFELGMGNKYEPPTFFQGIKSIEELAHTGIVTLFQPKILTKMARS